MTTPYTYLLKHIPTNTNYYGCRYAEGCDPSEFWVKYKTSSTHVKRLIEEYGEDSFLFEIRKIFDDKEKCREWEHKVLRRLNVVRRSDFINKTDNKAISQESAIIGLKNRTPSEKFISHITSVGKSNKGRMHSTEINKKKGVPGNKFSLGRKDNEATKLKKRNSKLGKPSNAVGNKQPRCSCLLCGKEITSSVLKRHYSYNHNSN